MIQHNKNFSAGREAELYYQDGDFQILRAGSFVRCAITEQPILLDNLRYWNVDLQEAYASPELARQRLVQMGKIIKKPAL